MDLLIGHHLLWLDVCRIGHLGRDIHPRQHRLVPHAEDHSTRPVPDPRDLRARPHHRHPRLPQPIHEVRIPRKYYLALKCSVIVCSLHTMHNGQTKGLKYSIVS